MAEKSLSQVSSFGPTLTWDESEANQNEVHHSPPQSYYPSKATSTTDETQSRFIGPTVSALIVPPNRPPPSFPDCILPKSRIDFILSLPEHEVKEILSPVKHGLLSSESVLSVKHAPSNMAISIAAGDFIAILKSKGKYDDDLLTESGYESVHCGSEVPLNGQLKQSVCSKKCLLIVVAIAAILLIAAATAVAVTMSSKSKQQQNVTSTPVATTSPVQKSSVAVHSTATTTTTVSTTSTTTSNHAKASSTSTQKTIVDQCRAGWTGGQCDIPIDYCNNQCQTFLHGHMAMVPLCIHGTCNYNQATGSRCDCEEGWSGDYCQIATKTKYISNRCVGYLTSYTKEHLNDPSVVQNNCDLKKERCIPDNLDCMFNVPIKYEDGKPVCEPNCKCKYPVGWCIPQEPGNNIKT